MVEHAYARLSNVVMHYAACGAPDADPIVLLHGWPQTWREWRHVMPRLVQAGLRVIAPDLRGLGDTSRPLDGYDSASVAADVAELVIERLGYERFHLVGHDWGGPTAFALAAAHPQAVRTLAIVDATVPGIGLDFSQGGKRWHHEFHNTPDLAEALTDGREHIYLGWFYRTFGYKPDAISAEDLAEYLRTYTQPGAMRAGFSYYRALEQDAADNRAMIEREGKLEMPVLAMGGAVSYPHGRGRGSEPEDSLKRVAVNVTGVVVPECGHFIPEEAPAVVAENLLTFFAQ